MSVDLPRLLEVVQEAASRAERAFKKGEFTVHEKAKGDWVSTVDAEVEAFLKKELSELCPQAQFLGEEGGLSSASTSQGSAQDPASLTWVVDPIDGTANFVRGIAHFCCVVALVDANQEPVIGLIVDPCREESFWAVKGQGAWFNGRALGATIDRSAMESLLAVVTPKPTSPIANALQLWLPGAVRGFGGIRRSGAMALDLAWLAAGRMDAFAGFDLDPWDVVAGSLLVREAGGQYQDRTLRIHQNNSTGVRRIAAAAGQQCLDALCALDGLVSNAAAR